MLPALTNNRELSLYENESTRLRQQIERDIEEKNNVQAEIDNLQLQIDTNFGNTWRNANGELIRNDGSVCMNGEIDDAALAAIQRAERTIERYGDMDGRFMNSGINFEEVINALRRRQQYIADDIARNTDLFEVTQRILQELRQNAQGDGGAAIAERVAPDIAPVVRETREGVTLLEDLAAAAQGVAVAVPEADPENAAVMGNLAAPLQQEELDASVLASRMTFE